MKKISDFTNSKISFVFTDIDDTLTDEGLLGSAAYEAMWKLYESQIHVVPVTGRPAGWCELIARQWPVSGVVGENGGFYFRYVNSAGKKEMRRHYFFSEAEQAANRAKLNKIREEILRSVPGSAIASDQFCRQMDLAVDFCEDVEPLPGADVKKIVSVFEKHGAIAKVSSIHVNGWFGNYDKLSMCKTFLKREFGKDLDAIQDEVCFVGDSPNDEPMFGYFKNSFAVKNVEKFLPDLKSKPAFVASHRGGAGFAEIAARILA
jgi:HAD superfamily hydrolase (TIGR01484 family)